MKKILLFIFVLSLISVAYSQSGINISTEKVIINGKKFYRHNVNSGETIYSLSKAYKVTEKDIIDNNPELAKSPLKAGQSILIPVVFETATNNENYIIYTVKPGDTLYSLCKRFGITEEKFYEINSDLNPSKTLKVNQQIKFPASAIDEKIEQKISEVQKDTTKYIYHIIEKGETVYNLTKKFNVTKEDLKSANPDFDGIKLKVGEVILIPRKNFSNEFALNTTQQNTYNTGKVVDNKSSDKCDSQNWYKNGTDFEIAILLPFEVNSNIQSLINQENRKQEQRLHSITEKIISFYSGILVGLENFSSKNINLKVKVYDTGKDNTLIKKLIDENNFANTDLIIGPAFNSQVEFINKNLFRNDLYYIIPFSSNQKILYEYSNNIFLKFTDNVVAEAIADYAANNPESIYIVIQGNTEDENHKSQIFYDAIKNKSSNLNLSFIKFSGSNLMELSSKVNKDVENVFILPFNVTNETQFTRILLNIFNLKDYQIRIISDKSHLDYETIDPNYYVKANFTYFSNSNIDYSNPETMTFISKYRDVFLCEPDEFSFLGYDASTFLIDKLLKYGNTFGECFNNSVTYDGLGGNILLKKYDNFANYSYVNKTVYLYSLTPDYTFIKIHP